MMLSSFLQQTVEEASHAAGAAGQGGAIPFEELPNFIQEELSDGPAVHFLGQTLDVGSWHLPSLHIGGLTLDLTPTRHLFFVVLAASICLAVFLPVARRLKRRDPTRAPAGFANAMEALVEYFRDQVVRPTVGRGADAYTPYILTVFFFVLFMNLLGLSPLAVSATGNLSVTAALAIISFLVIEISGFRALGPAGYAKTIFYLPPGLPTLMKPVMLIILTPVEFLGKLTKPFALAIRLFANMMAGHTLIMAVLGMIFVYQSFAVAGGSVLVTSVLMLLELLVAVIQAFIFAMLTSVFIGLIRHAH